MTAAEADRTRVDQVVGVAMVQQGVDPDQPLDRMRTRAFAQERTVGQTDAEAGTGGDARHDRPDGEEGR